MSFVKVLIHVVFSTKNREPYLINEEIQKKVWEHIINNGKEKGTL